MKRALILLFALSGCTSDIPTPMQTAQDRDFCLSISKPATDVYANCMITRDQSRMQGTQDRKSRSLALAGFGAGILSAQPAYYPPVAPRQTNCRYVVGNLVCRSY